MADAYTQLMTALREISLLGSINSLLHWDEETYMPAGGMEHRANQTALIARMTHEQFTSPRIGELLNAASASADLSDAHSDVAVNLRETKRSYDRAVKLPASLVEEMTRTATHAQHAWVDARKKNEFSIFAPWLTKTIDLKKQEAACLGYKDDPYDALLDAFEPGETTANLRRVFESLRKPLVELVAKIIASPRKAPVELLERRFSVEAQKKFAQDAAARIGFDFNSGRLDVSVHPFCTSIGPGDVRMTTRFNENDFTGAFFGVLHESGHGLYSQNLPAEHFGTPRGDDISLGIHESQSRMWENLVGRRKSFWSHFFPLARQSFKPTLDDVTLEQWYFAINDVRPSLIRTEADEATYNLHVLLRFEIEQDLLNGRLDVKDLPSAWNEKINQYLGLVPPTDTEGCLQDIHWSHGAFGYFPTYTLGNLYAAQFYEQARQDMGDLDAMFAEGTFAPLLNWLKENIHAHGKRYTAPQLIEHVTGKPLSAEPLLKHLRGKAAELYGV